MVVCSKETNTIAILLGQQLEIQVSLGKTESVQ